MFTVNLFLLLLLGAAYTATNRTFPINFKFGVTTASYQIEGAWNEDGKGENIWDHICHTNPDYVVLRHNGDVACDAYHRWQEDIANIKSLGVDFYRLSLSWSRILPTGFTDEINQIGINYYRNLIQSLLDEGIEPMVTIFHWDTPQPIEDIGGFINPQIEEFFVDYARIVFEQFGDLVKTWLTFNEPAQICHEGYGNGNKAPGIISSGLKEYHCTHTLLKAHARTWHLYNDNYRQVQKGRVGITIDSHWYQPEDEDDPLDREAAERALQFHFGWFANPIFNRNYPQVMIDRIKNRSLQEGYDTSRLPEFSDEELDYISGTYDYFGLNYYTTDLVRWIEDAPIGNVSFDNDLSAYLYKDPSWNKSASDWLTVTPWGIRSLLNWVKNNLNNPEILITENGVSDHGDLDDQSRILYYKEHLDNLLSAILDDGVNVTGYTAWSLMDNFEWRRGYMEKFGLYYVDFNDTERKRTPKASAEWYKNVVATHSIDNYIDIINY